MPRSFGGAWEPARVPWACPLPHASWLQRPQGPQCLGDKGFSPGSGLSPGPSFLGVHPAHLFSAWTPGSPRPTERPIFGGRTLARALARTRTPGERRCVSPPGVALTQVQGPAGGPQSPQPAEPHGLPPSLPVDPAHPAQPEGLRPRRPGTRLSCTCAGRTSSSHSGPRGRRTSVTRSQTDRSSCLQAASSPQAPATQGHQDRRAPRGRGAGVSGSFKLGRFKRVFLYTPPHTPLISVVGPRPSRRASHLLGCRRLCANTSAPSSRGGSRRPRGKHTCGHRGPRSPPKGGTKEKRLKG